MFMLADSFVIIGSFLIVWNLSWIITWRLHTFHESHEDNLFLNMAQLCSKIPLVMIMVILLKI